MTLADQSFTAVYGCDTARRVPPYSTLCDAQSQSYYHIEVIDHAVHEDPYSTRE